MVEFNKLTIELLAHKYRYYVLNTQTISDREYDALETSWVALGKEQGIDMDNYPNWVDFDENHPLALKAKETANE